MGTDAGAPSTAQPVNEQAAKDRGRIVTVPNLITLVRLLCVPLFVWLLADDELLAAAGLLAVLGATDWVDG